MSLVFLDFCQKSGQLFNDLPQHTGTMVTTMEILHTPFIISEQKDFSPLTHWRLAVTMSLFPNQICIIFSNFSEVKIQRLLML